MKFTTDIHYYVWCSSDFSSRLFSCLLDVSPTDIGRIAMNFGSDVHVRSTSPEEILQPSLTFPFHATSRYTYLIFNYVTTQCWITHPVIYCISTTASWICTKLCSCSPEDESLWLWWSLSTTMRSTSVVQSKISQQLSDKSTLTLFFNALSLRVSVEFSEV